MHKFTDFAVMFNNGTGIDNCSLTDYSSGIYYDMFADKNSFVNLRMFTDFS